MESALEKKWWETEAHLLRLTLLGIAILYFWTAPSRVTFEDAGMFLTTSFHWGLAHPPGYPLYTFLSHLFMKLPVASPAQLGSWFSCLMGLGALRVSYSLFRRLGLDMVPALVALLCLGLGQTFWNQMVVPEVYALRMFLFMSLLLVASHLGQSWSKKKLGLFYVLFGLSLANHWPLLILGSPLFLALAWDNKAKVLKSLVWLPMSVLIASCFYFLMYWRSNSGVDYSFLGPMDQLGDIWRYLTRSYYEVADKQLPYNPVESFKFFLGFLWTQGVWEMTPLFFIGALLGVKQKWSSVDIPRAVFFLYAFLSTPIILTTTQHFEFNELNYNVHRVFQLVPHFVVCVFFGYALQTGLKRYRWPSLLLALGVVLVGGVDNFNKNNMHSDHLADGYARLILDAMPENAILFAATDADVGPLSYVSGVEGYRDDVDLMTQTGVFFPRKMFDPYEFGRNFRTRKTLQFLKNEAPVYSTKRFDILSNAKDVPLNFDYNGIFYLVSQSYSEKAPKSDAMIERAKALVEHQLEQQQLFNWPYHREVVMSRLCNLLVLNGEENHRVFTENRACQIILARHLRALKQHEKSSEIFREILSRFSTRFMMKNEYIDLFYIDLLNQLDWVNYGLAGTDARLAHVVEAVDFASEALSVYTECDNPVFKLIVSIKPQQEWTKRTRDRLAPFKKCQ